MKSSASHSSEVQTAINKICEDMYRYEEAKASYYNFDFANGIPIQSATAKFIWEPVAQKKLGNTASEKDTEKIRKICNNSWELAIAIQSAKEKTGGEDPSKDEPKNDAKSHI